MRKMALIIVLMAVIILICPPAYVPGDIDHNGRIDSTDRYLIAGYILGECDLDQDQLRSADINGDGRLTNSDLTLLSRF